ncbi:killer cell lectin-like receptor subfamily G member 1 [Melanerpes formicivorus]|uniref:killer cell lectin-like receptor subfamily G member 1 n=1 Tax=Melanerpes formicivorus TaxID=211600 RepID=UPI00358FED0F
MTQEVTYANLKFEKSYELDNIRERKDTKEKGPPPSSHSNGPAVWILLTLCLVLLAALVALAVLLFQIPQDCRTQLRNLNVTNNELRANFSKALQNIGNQLCLEGEDDFNGNKGLNCVFCPVNWQLKGGNTCYYLSEEKKTWKQSHQFCSSRNSTLLLIKDVSKLGLVGTFPRSTYWIGLTFRDEQKDWYWTDNTAVTEGQKAWVNLEKPSRQCVYFYYNGLGLAPCGYDYHCVCEKPAIRLQPGRDPWHS